MLEHHPNGDGSTLSPIRARYFTYSTWIYPTIEEALLGDFTKINSKRKHKDVARILFTSGLEEGFLKLLETNWLQDSNFNPQLLYFVCCSGAYSMEEMQEIELDEDFVGDYKWNPKIDVTQNPFHMYIWMRVNCTAALSIYHKYRHMDKLHAFWDGHLQLLQHIDSGKTTIDFSLYQSLGRSYHDVDRKYIECTRYTILDNDHEDVDLDLDTVDDVDLLLMDTEEDVPEYFYKCEYMLEKCRNLFETDPRKARIRQACFVDVYSDGTFEETMKYYPYSNRSFTDDDLPDLFPALFQIPLYGLKMDADFGNAFIVRCFQKCLPFASQSRRLAQAVVKEMTVSPAFNNLICKLFWCMLTNMYSSPACPFLTMNYLLRVDYICNTPKVLLVYFKAIKKQDDLCPILRLAFQLYIVKLLETNPWYMEATASYIDWKSYIKVTHKQHASIFKDVNIIYSEDWIQQMTPGIRHFETPIHHYFEETPAGFLAKLMFQTLQHEIFPKLLQEEMVTLDEAETIEKYLEDPTILSVETKQNILDILINIPIEQRYTPESISILQLEMYGGVDRESLKKITEFLCQYSSTIKPKGIKTMLQTILYTDFCTVLWYFYVVTLLEKIQIVPLPPSVTAGIDTAMLTNRYVTLPGQELSPTVYDVYISLCCGNVKTLDWNHSFGTTDIVYDVDTQESSCSHTSNTPVSINAELTLKDVKKGKGYIHDKHVNKRIRDMKTEFTHIPCVNNPVLRVNLRGFLLRYRATKSTWIEYIHCPSCGAFHKYKHGNWTTQYHCDECLVHEPVAAICCMCEITLQQKTLEKASLTIINPDPNREGDYIQHLYFCKKHRRAAYTSAKYNVGKEEAFTNATRKVQQDMKNRAGMTYKV